MVEKAQMAALSGVLAFLRNEEEDRRRAVLLPAGPRPASQWALYGRKTVMRMRALVQSRALRGRAKSSVYRITDIE